MSEGENQAKNEAVTEVAQANTSLDSTSSATKLASDTFTSPAFKPEVVVQTNADNLLLARANFDAPAANNPVVKPETVKPQTLTQPENTVNSLNLPLANTQGLLNQKFDARNFRFDPRTLDPRQAPGFYGNVQNSESDIFPFFAQERLRPEVRLENLNRTQVSDRPEIQEIINASKFYNGAILWHGTKYERSVSEGRFASAAAVSRVLQDVGYNYADSSKPANLLNKLVANGWEVVGMSQAKPGDIVIGGKTNTQWREGNDNAVAGIVGPNGTVYSTGGEGGRWTQGTMDQLFPADQYKDQIWVLRPPKGLPPINDFNPNLNPNQMSDMPQMPGRINYDQFSSTFRNHVQRDFNQPNPNMLPGYNPNGQFEQQPNQYTQPNQYRVDQMPQQWVNPRQPSDVPNERPPVPPPGVNVYEFYDAYYKNKWEQYYKAKYERGDFNRPGNDRTQGPEILDGQRSQQRSAQIFDLARRSVGRPVWQTSEWADKTDNGRNASATSVGEILKAAGFEYAHPPGVADLTKTMIRHGWQPTALNNLRPGDIIYGATQDGWENKSGPTASMGIVGENGMVYICDRRTGNWARMRMEEAFPPEQYGRRMWAVRAPERDVQPTVADPPRRNQYPADNPNSYEQPNTTYSSAAADAIANTAMQSNGRQMWTDTGANLGCAQAVAGMLRAANVRIDNLRRVGDVFDALQKNQWQAIQTDKSLTGLKPGDVIVCGRAPGMQWKGVDGGAHMGIVGADGKIYSNNSRTGVVIGVDAERFTRDSRYQSFYILRSPGSDQPNRPGRRPNTNDGPQNNVPMTEIQRLIAQTAGKNYTGSYGWCARAVQRDLAAAHPALKKWVGSGDAWNMGQAMLRSGEWVQVPSQDAQPGDVLALRCPGQAGDIRIVKSRNGDNIDTVNDNKYSNENVNIFGNKQYKKYDKGIFLRYVGDRQNAPQQTVQPPRNEEYAPQPQPDPRPRYQPQPYERSMPYQRPYQNVPNVMSFLPPQLANRIPPQLMNQIPNMMERLAPGMMRNMPPEMMNLFGAQPYYPQQNPYADPYAGQYDQNLDPYGDQNPQYENQENDFQDQDQDQQQAPTNNNSPDYWNYYNQRRRGYEQYQDQYRSQQQDAERRRADNERQQQQQQADAERQRQADAERQRANNERQRQQEADRERARMEAERNRSRK